MKVLRAAGGSGDGAPGPRSRLPGPGPRHLLGGAGDHHPGRPPGARRRRLGQDLPEGLHLRPARRGRAGRRPADDRYIPPMKGHFYDIVPFYSTVPVRVKSYQRDHAARRKSCSSRCTTARPGTTPTCRATRREYFWEVKDIAAFQGRGRHGRPFRRRPQAAALHLPRLAGQVAVVLQGERGLRLFRVRRRDQGQGGRDRARRQRRLGKDLAPDPLGGRGDPLFRHLHGPGRGLHPAQGDDDLPRPLRRVQGQGRHADHHAARRRLRVLPGHDHGRLAHRPHPGRPVQPQRHPGQGRRQIPPARPHLGAGRARALVVGRAAAGVPDGRARGGRPGLHAGLAGRRTTTSATASTRPSAATAP